MSDKPENFDETVSFKDMAGELFDGEDKGGQNSEAGLNSEACGDEALLNELAAAKENLVRATADFENIKKRLEREKAEAVKYACEGFARDLLPVIDALEIAANLPADDDVAAKIKDGINLTIEQFKKCFEKYGISEVATDGEFDPEVHNAINYAENTGVEAGKIAQVYQKGYTYNGRTIRAAMVVIAK